MINCDFSDYYENREIIISQEPKLQTCSNLYSPLHWGHDGAWKPKYFQNSLKIRLSRTISMERQCDDKLVFLGWRRKQGKYYFSITKAPKLFQLLWTSPLVGWPGLEEKELTKLFEIRLSRKVSVERKFDTKLDLFGLRGNQGKYYSLRSKAPKLFRLIGTSPLVAGLAVRAETLIKFLEIRLSRKVSVERQCDENWEFSDYGETTENIISREPKLKTCSNLYSPLHVVPSGAGKIYLMWCRCMSMSIAVCICCNYKYTSRQHPRWRMFDFIMTICSNNSQFIIKLPLHRNRPGKSDFKEFS